MSNTDARRSTDASSEQQGSYDRSPERLPAHLASPKGLSREIHEIDILVGVIALRAQASLNWLNRASPDLLAAKASAEALIDSVHQLRGLTGNLKV